jgi:hypothetical protein
MDRTETELEPLRWETGEQLLIYLFIYLFIYCSFLGEITKCLGYVMLSANKEQKCPLIFLQTVQCNSLFARFYVH